MKERGREGTSEGVMASEAPVGRACWLTSSLCLLNMHHSRLLSDVRIQSWRCWLGQVEVHMDHQLFARM